MNEIPDETPEPEQAEPEQAKKFRPLLILTISTVLLYVSVLGMLIWNFSTVQQNKGVLCALKAEHERDIRNSLKFLENNPRGIQGIPAELIEQGIEEDRQTLAAFDDLTCPLDE